MMKLAGSCRCGAVIFAVDTHTPYPYQLCYCSICRKTAGGGGFAINIMAASHSLKMKGEKALGLYRAKIKSPHGTTCETSSGERRFCVHCASALWLYDPEWPDLIHPFASAIDTDLPVPPERTHLMLRYKASWVQPVVATQDLCFDEYPEASIEQWHRQRGLWLD